MDQFNHERPLIMHIDLNSCFASVEQQARPMLRGKPVAIVNRRTENTSIVTASYEAKARGVTVGMKFRDAKIICPDLVGLESDPFKYRYVYHKLLDIMQDYSAHVRMKSIDEGVIDFNSAPESITSRDLVDIGHEIKERLKNEIGLWMRCNIGISTNRFLAKTAAGLNKPDGLDIITPLSIFSTLQKLQLRDLTGISWRNERRLNSVGIMTPLQFLNTDVITLEKVVFKSVIGRWWYDRLRGWEVDDRDFDIKRVGRQYVLERFDLTRQQIVQRLHHLSEAVGSRMRSQNKSARGVYVYAKTLDRKYWHRSSLSSLPFYSDDSIFRQAEILFRDAPGNIKEIGIHCYDLQSASDDQLSLFAEDIVKERQVVGAIDDINRRFGDRTIHSADTLDTNFVKAKIPFGSTRYL